MELGAATALLDTTKLMLQERQETLDKTLGQEAAKVEEVSAWHSASGPVIHHNSEWGTGMQRHTKCLQQVQCSTESLLSVVKPVISGGGGGGGLQIKRLRQQINTLTDELGMEQSTVAALREEVTEVRPGFTYCLLFHSCASLITLLFRIACCLLVWVVSVIAVSWGAPVQAS